MTATTPTMKWDSLQYNLVSGTWYHMIVTWHSVMGLKLYINGVMVANMQGAPRVPSVSLLIKNVGQKLKMNFVQKGMITVSRLIQERVKNIRTTVITKLEIHSLKRVSLFDIFWECPQLFTALWSFMTYI